MAQITKPAEKMRPPKLPPHLVTMASELPAGSLDSTFYTRWSPMTGGPYPLRVTQCPDGTEQYALERGKPGGPELFGTWSKLVKALHGPEYLARHWSKDRYLGRGRHQPSRDKGEPGIIIVGPLEVQQLETIVVAPSLEGLVGLEEPRGPIIHVPERVGIDLERRGHEVAKLLFAGFSSWIRTAGYDPEDVLQDVYRKILVANHGTRPWDPNKSSFGHYVHMICRSALSNHHRKQSRVRSKEQLGLPGISPDGTWAMVEVGSSNSTKVSRQVVGDNPVEDLQKYILGGPHREHPQAQLAAALVPCMDAGHTLKGSADLLGVERTVASKAMKLLRVCAQEWSS